MKLLIILCLLTLLLAVGTQAQLLPNNSMLNVQSVARWMQSNRDFATIIQAVDGMFNSEEALTAFDHLPATEQDLKINIFLQQQKIFDRAKALCFQHGWKSVGEYRRLSTRLGNAIAAHFLAGKTLHLSAEEKKALLAKSDPAVVAVSLADISFVKQNENLLKIYIQGYAQGQ
jgi:hypothetical protein